VTILVAPLMSCSARLPVYTLLIAACIPDIKILGFLKLQGLTMLAMYLLGTVVALLMAWLFKKTLLKGETPMLIMELPPYKRPLLRVVARHMWDRARLFLRRAGTVILGINILLWFLATYPKPGNGVMEHRSDEGMEKAATPNTPTLQHSAPPPNSQAHNFATALPAAWAAPSNPSSRRWDLTGRWDWHHHVVCGARSFREHDVHGL